MKKKKKENFLMKKVTTFLKDKPLWAWWVSYAVITGALFGIFRLAFYLLGKQPIVGVFVLLMTAIMWGSLRYFQLQKKEKKFESEEDEE